METSHYDLCAEFYAVEDAVELAFDDDGRSKCLRVEVLTPADQTPHPSVHIVPLAMPACLSAKYVSGPPPCWQAIFKGVTPGSVPRVQRRWPSCCDSIDGV